MSFRAVILAAASFTQNLGREPLVPGRELELGPGETQLRYRALGETRLRVEAWCEGAGEIELEALGLDGERIAGADPDPARGVALELDADAGMELCIRARVEAADGARLFASEDPDFESWARAQPFEPLVQLDPDGKESMGAAEAAYTRARGLAVESRDAARAELVRALAILDEHPDFALSSAAIDGRRRCAGLAYELGDVVLAARAWGAAVAAVERTRSPADHELQTNRVNWAIALRDAGELEPALEACERALSILERTLSPADETFLWARMNLALTAGEMERWSEAVPILRGVLESLQRRHDSAPPGPSDPRDRLAGWRLSLFAAAHTNLGRALSECGDTAGALPLFERSIELRARFGSPRDPSLFKARVNAATARTALGDLAGAQALLEEALAGRGEGSLAADHESLVASSQLSAVLSKRGLHEQALALLDGVIEALDASPSQKRLWLAARSKRAAELAEHDGLQPSLDEYDAVERAYAEEGWESGVAARILRVKRARVLARLGRLEEALAAVEAENASLASLLSIDAPQIRSLHGMRALLGAQLGDERLDVYLEELLDAIRARLRVGELRSPREVATLLAIEEDEIGVLLSLAPRARAPRALEREVFELVESARALARAPLNPSSALRSDPETARVWNEANRARADLNDLVAGLLGDAEPDADYAARLRDAQRARDRAESALRARLESAGAVGPAVDAAELARSLPEDCAAVGVRRYGHTTPVGPPEPRLDGEDRFLAHVVSRAGGLARIDRRPAEPKETAVASGRAARGTPLGQSRGPDVVPIWTSKDSSAETLARAGAELRALVLDPILRAAPGARTLLLCPDDVLALVPWDALPAQDGSLVGDRLRIRPLATLAEAGGDRHPGPPGKGLLVLAGIAYDAESSPAAAPASATRSLAASPPLADERGSAGAALFRPLPSSVEEGRAIAELFERSAGETARVLLGERASKAAFLAAAPGARFLHVATHGYFAGEEIASLLDRAQPSSAGWRLGLAEEVQGLAPLSLCGLALARANHGRNARGEVEGILTAEELAGVDLGACELAVLSACDTHVGLRRAGQGILSLQASLHAAGARSALASLWKVDDEAARELMLSFYRAIWSPGASKSDALWAAKKSLASAGRPAREWAGWVLSGAD